MKTPARFALLAAAAVLIAGCATAKKPTAAPLSTRSPAEILDAVKAELGTSGRAYSINDVDEPSGWFSIDQATPGDFPLGTVVSVVDENAQTIGFGTVGTSEPGKVYAKFTRKDAGGRNVRVGDVAVKF